MISVYTDLGVLKCDVLWNTFTMVPVVIGWYLKLVAAKLKTCNEVTQVLLHKGQSTCLQVEIYHGVLIILKTAYKES